MENLPKTSATPSEVPERPQLEWWERHPVSAGCLTLIFIVCLILGTTTLTVWLVKSLIQL